MSTIVCADCSDFFSGIVKKQVTYTVLCDVIDSTGILVGKSLHFDAVCTSPHNAVYGGSRSRIFRPPPNNAVAHRYTRSSILRRQPSDSVR